MSKETTKKAGKDRVFSVSIKTGPIETVYTQVAVDDCKDNFTAETATKMLTDGELIFSEEFYYSSNRELLTPFEVKAEAVEQAAPVAESEALAIVAPEALEVIEGEVVLDPLTDKERKKLVKLESEYEKVDAVERAIPFEKGRILNEIRISKLFRETHQYFGEYAVARFGITREYAQNLAQISGIPELLEEAVNTDTGYNLSVGAANEIMRESNKITKALGIGKVEFELLAPVMRNVVAVMVDVAPKNEAGEVQITPRFVTEFNQTLAAHLTDGVVEIDGQQYTVKAAQEAGLLNVGLRSEVLEATAESIKRNAATISTEFQAQRDRQEKGISNGGSNGHAANDKDVKYFKGKVPVLDISCKLHGDTEITSIGSGKFQTRCGCRWWMSAESGELQAYQVNDLPVKL